MNKKHLGAIAPIGWLVFAASLLAFALAPSVGAATIGNCHVSGKKGTFHITPAIPGQLTVEVSLPAPGWWNGDTPSTIKDGYEYCMAANIAHRVGLDKVAVVPIAWGQLIAGHTKNFDLSLSEISITPARKKVVDFSIPYFDSNIGILVKKGTKVDRSTIKTMRIGVHQGSTGARFVADNLKPAKPVRVFPDVSSMFTALVAGQIDAVLTDTAFVLGQAAHSNGTLVVAGQYKTGETYGAIYPTNSPNEATFNKIIQSMIDDGTLKRLAHKYLTEAWGQDPTQIPFLKP